MHANKAGKIRRSASTPRRTSNANSAPPRGTPPPPMRQTETAVAAPESMTVTEAAAEAADEPGTTTVISDAGPELKTTAPKSYVVRRGQTFRPKEMCFYPTPGVKVKSVQLQDDYAMNPVTINLKSPI